MTPITLNLLVEEQLAHEASTRDPLRLAILAGVSLLAVAVALGGWTQALARRKQIQAAALQQKWAVVEAAQAQAGAGFAAVKMFAEDILAVNQSRVLYAPELALIKDLIPETVQLTALKFTTAREIQAPEELPAPSKNDDEPVKLRRPAVKTTERVILQLDGKAVGARPEMLVDNFIKSLGESAAFRAKVERVELRSIVRNPVTVEGAMPVENIATFVIECQYKERQ